jgi:hypothetical protein
MKITKLEGEELSVCEDNDNVDNWAV